MVDRRRRYRSLCNRSGFFAALVFASLLLVAQPSAAAWEWDGSAVEAAAAKAVDAILVRPVATARVAVGAVLLVPSTIFALPSGSEGIATAYDVLVVEPSKFAFERELGDF